MDFQFSGCVYNRLTFVFQNVFVQKFIVLLFLGKVCIVKFVGQNNFFFHRIAKAFKLIFQLSIWGVFTFKIVFSSSKVMLYFQINICI